MPTDNTSDATVKKLWEAAYQATEEHSEEVAVPKADEDKSRDETNQPWISIDEMMGLASGDGFCAPGPLGMDVVVVCTGTNPAQFAVMVTSNMAERGALEWNLRHTQSERYREVLTKQIAALDGASG